MVYHYSCACGALWPFLESLRVLWEPSYGPKTVLQNIRIMVFLVFGSGARILLFSIFNLDSTQKDEPHRHTESSEMMKNISGFLGGL